MVLTLSTNIVVKYSTYSKLLLLQNGKQKQGYCAKLIFCYQFDGNKKIMRAKNMKSVSSKVRPRRGHEGPEWE
jgi:hypothetical protein